MIITRTLRRDYERNLTLNIKNNPKAFWRYVNSRLKVHPTIDDLQRPDGSTALHIQMETKQKHLTTSLLMYSLKKTYH